MFEITIDTDLCKKDGLCAMTCPVAVLQQDEQVTIPTIATDHLESCFAADSVCPFFRRELFHTAIIRRVR